MRMANPRYWSCDRACPRAFHQRTKKIEVAPTNVDEKKTAKTGYSGPGDLCSPDAETAASKAMRGVVSDSTESTPPTAEAAITQCRDVPCTPTGNERVKPRNAGAIRLAPANATRMPNSANVP